MAFLKRIVIGYFSFLKCVSCTNFRLFTTHNRNFEYFRNKSNYKSSLVELNSNLTECKLAGPGFSFLVKEQDIQTDGFFYHLMQRENVMKLSVNQLKEIMCLLANSKIDIVKYNNALKYIDEKCALGVERWPLDLSLYVLDAWFIILGPRVFKKCYYSAITSVWSRKMKKCSKCNLILILYFVGLSKRSPPFLMELLEDKLESYASNLTDEEWAIACLSFFKTGTKIESDLLLKQSCKIAENLVCQNNRFHLISILKCLRLSRYYNAHLISILEEYIIKEHESFNFVECTNFLATLATQNIYNFEVYRCLENQGIFSLSLEDPEIYDKSIEKLHPSERSRMKDLARFMWGMAFVGHDLLDKSLDFIVNMLNIRLSTGELENHLVALTDCLQSLVLLNHYPPNLIEYILNPNFKHKLLNTYKAKPKYQLYFIYRSIFIEHSINQNISMKFISHIPKNLETDIEERAGFKDLIHLFSDILKENSFKCCYIMPHVMIAGIVISTKLEEGTYDKSIYNSLLKLIDTGIISKDLKNILNEGGKCICIEVLDPSVCVYGTTEPLALMKTKIRQLKKLNINVVTLTPEEITLFKNSNKSEKYSKLRNIIV